MLAASGAKKTAPANVRSDMRRLSVVMAIAALDTYMHRLIIERVYTYDELPSVLAKLDVTFEQMLGWADEAKTAARATPHNSRPRVGVKRQLRDRLLRETFQNYNDVGKGINMAGCAKKWDEIGKRLTPRLRPEEIRERLNAIVMRRNQIVHEGDYKRMERPRDAARNGLTSAQAAADINFIAELIDALHAVL
jgi:hypothetical protein